MKKLIKIVITCAFFTSSLIFGATRNAQASVDIKSTLNADENIAPLVLKHAKEIFSQKKDGLSRLVWHESHSSHVSHESHESHFSHYSGDSDTADQQS
jgi:hypothetical protein